MSNTPCEAADITVAEWWLFCPFFHAGHPYAVQDLSEELSFLTIEGNVYLETPAMDTLAKNGFEISRDTR